jgi:hypothetical protein
MPDVKDSELPTTSTLDPTDLVAVTTDLAGTPTTKAITVADLGAALGGGETIHPIDLTGFNPYISSPTRGGIFSDGQWVFTDGSEQSIAGYVYVPAGWGNFDVVLVWRNTSSATGDVAIGAETRTIGADNSALIGTQNINYNLSQTGAVTARGSGVRHDIDIGSMNRPSSGWFILRVSRYGSVTPDTLSGSYGLAFGYLVRNS